ncbi:hypothetical protein GCM10027280_28000 [Micromonospora polyrhachis]|uniref:Uncharacterized protein n=1 Tax=Micromonospora polyrhachis TaxID=1282883 RepID=A0A7W7WQB8_9ACTN|nr:hypothetical protein [Micromonospora polyrhachis]MBB4959327.1 hypothetical protein [Micromonospora polyrhachis]
MLDFGTSGMISPQSRSSPEANARAIRMMTRWPMRQILVGQFQKSDAIVLKGYTAQRQRQHTGA